MSNLNQLLDAVEAAEKIAEKAVTAGDHYLVPIYRSLHESVGGIRRRLAQIESVSEDIKADTALKKKVKSDKDDASKESSKGKEAKDSLGKLA